jgi:hypothetical protein
MDSPGALFGCQKFGSVREVMQEKERENGDGDSEEAFENETI